MLIRGALVLLTALAMLFPAVPVANLGAVAQSPARRIALSFDDVPRGAGAFLDREDRSRRLIAALREARVHQVVFFVNPGRVAPGDAGEAMIAAYVKAGHVIADHSFSHPHLSKLSAEAYLADVDKAEAWLKGRAGYRPWFRFPFLDEGGPDKVKRDAVRAGLAARGLRNGHVTAESSDWNIEALTIEAKRAGKTMDMDGLRDLYVESHVEAANFADALMVKAIGRSPVHMMLLHETDLAAMYIGDLVRALRKQGWEIVTADEAMADPVYAAMPDVPWANGTLTEAIAWEKKLPPPRWYARNDTGIANPLFAERVLKERPVVAIPEALRGCWQLDDEDYPGDHERLIVEANAIRRGARHATPAAPTRMDKGSIEARFTTLEDGLRITVATELFIDKDVLTVREGDAGSFLYSRCR